MKRSQQEIKKTTTVTLRKDITRRTCNAKTKLQYILEGKGTENQDTNQYKYMSKLTRNQVSIIYQGRRMFKVKTTTKKNRTT